TDRHVDRTYRTTFRALGVELHLDQLGPDPTAHDRILAGFQRGLEYIEFVRIDRPLNNGFAQTVRRGDEDHIWDSRFRVDGEHHPGRTEVGAHHTLNPRRQGALGVVKAFVNAIRDRAIVVQRSEHVTDFVEHLVD